MTGAYSRNKGARAELSCPGVYGIRHCESGRLYVGSSVNVWRRWAGHRCDLRKGRHHSQRLQNAWRKYGAEAFEFFMIEQVADKGLLPSCEQARLEELKPFYNICPEAGTSRGVSHGPRTAEHRRKIAEGLRGRQFSPQHRQRLSDVAKGNKRCVGRKFSEETKRKMSEKRRGVRQSPEQVAKRVLANTGQKRTAETKARIAEAARAVWAARKAGVAK